MPVRSKVFAMANEASPDRPGGEVLPRENLRASHEDRDQVVEQLRVAGGDGRLDAEELDQRLEAALTARTYGQLAALVADLPTGPVGRAGAPAPRPKDEVRIECRHGNTRREGRWAVPQRMVIQVRHGNVVLDFTQAEITWPTLQLDIDLHHGNLVLKTRPGVIVDADDLTMQGGNARIRSPRGPEVPAVLRVGLSGRVRHGNMVARLPFRSFWDWLRRRPNPYVAALPSGRP
jgi:hypothetical protein